MSYTKINILFSSYPDFSGHPKALFEYIQTNYADKFNLYWVIYNNDFFEQISQKSNLNCILFNSENYLKIINQIDIIFDTNGFLFSEKRKNQIYVNLWHGFSPKKTGYLMEKQNLAIQDNKYYELARKKTDYLVVPSEFAKLVFSSTFNVNAQQVLPLGYCRTDYLYNCNGRNNLQKLTNINITKFKKIIFYLPTFRKGINRNDSESIFENNLLNLQKYEESELLNFLEEKNYLLVIKKHPAEEYNIKNINHPNILILKDDIMTEKYITLYEILNAADLLLADYSSVYVEYLILEKPVIFFHKDIDSYTKNRGLILEDNDIWFPGPKVNDLDNLFVQIEKLLYDLDYYKSERYDFRKLMFTDSKTACKDIFNFFFDENNCSLRQKNIQHPEEILEDNISVLNSKIKNLESEISYLHSELAYLHSEYDKLSNLYGITSVDKQILQTEINNIYNSKSWKILSVFQKLKGTKKNTNL